MTAEIKCKHEQEIYILLGNIKNPVIAVGKVRGMYVNDQYSITYVIMDLHVVWTKNERFKIGEFLSSENITNDDLGMKAFFEKEKIKTKIREMRQKENG